MKNKGSSVPSGGKQSSGAVNHARSMGGKKESLDGLPTVHKGGKGNMAGVSTCKKCMSNGKLSTY